jgi:1,4-alpha-glucan branching enzyme
VVAANLTPVPRHGYRLGVPERGGWRVVLDTDAGAYGGSGHELVPGGAAVLAADDATPWQGQPASLLLTLPPLSVVVLVPA